MNVLRGAVIGFGKLGLLHAGLVNGLAGSELAVVVETSPLIQRAIRQYFPHVTVLQSVAELVATHRPDFAVIATPTDSHVEIATDLVNQKIPVFIEKPLSLTAKQAEPLLAALSKSWVPNMVGYMGRFMDTFRHAHKLISLGVLGNLVMVRSSMYVEQLLEPGSGWRYDPTRSGGGVLVTQNSHVVDKLIWMVGELYEVSGFTTQVVSRSVEDYAHAFLKFSNGAVGYLDASWSVRHFRTPTISVHLQGSNGTLEVSDDHVDLYLDRANSGYPSGWSHWRLPDLYEPVPLDIGGTHYTRQMLTFLTAVRSGLSVESDVASALKTQRAIDAIYASARQSGASVRLSQ